MNLLNYATLPACKRLQEAGITIETEAVWYLPLDEEIWVLRVRSGVIEADNVLFKIPAPSMAEVMNLLRKINLSANLGLSYRKG
jgi:hypothetical protein